MTYLGTPNYEKELIPISKMAELHGISRQALILYDKMELFTPAYKSESGYRYYDANQIPELREICFLRQLGVSLPDIQSYMTTHSPELAYKLLEREEKRIQAQLEELQIKKRYILQRKEIFAGMRIKFKNVYNPVFTWLDAQTVIFAPFPSPNPNKRELHTTLMKTWGELRKYDMMPAKGFRTLLEYDECANQVTPLGTIVRVPFPEKVKGANLFTLPAGEYVSMYKWGMPYDLHSIHELIDWIGQQGYEVAGRIFDLCLLDSLYHDENRKEDFCQLIVPIRRKETVEKIK